MERKDFNLLVLLTSAILFIGVFVLANSTQKPAQLTQKRAKEDKIEILESNVALIADFPDFPVYPGARLLNSYKFTREKRAGYEATWELIGSSPEYVTWYLDELAKRGWELVEGPGDFDYLRAQFFKFSKGTETLNLRFIPEDDGEITSVLVEFPVRQ